MALRTDLDGAWTSLKEAIRLDSELKEPRAALAKLEGWERDARALRRVYRLRRATGR